MVTKQPSTLPSIWLDRWHSCVADDLARGGGPCKSAIYDKSAVVFDAVVICGTSGVSQAKVDHFSELDVDASTLRQAWELAESEQLYSYDDPTCDSTCKVTEFVYLATAAYLGCDADLQTDELRISDQEHHLALLGPSDKQILGFDVEPLWTGSRVVPPVGLERF